MNHKDILSALDQQFSTNVNTVLVNSLNKEISFREVTVKEQKTLTKIIIDNEGREDVIYEATLAMIQSLCLTEEFDVLDINEFDRIKLVLALYRQNFFNNKFNYECNSCGNKDIREIDFDIILEQLDKIDLADKVFDISNSTHTFSFTINFPKIKRVRSYLKQLTLEKNSKNVKNKLSSTDYIDLFIKSMKIINKNDNSEIDVNFEEYNINDVEEIISKLPQGIFMNRNDVCLVEKITKDFLAVVDSSFNKTTCSKCGCDISLEVGLADFFMF